ncbi:MULTISPECIES: META domain-containing protein [unclassified Streptomyces]|uniref:META domain-containing protein n=1 Tax=unclassified Streptomyces TaxID=2593676 RepID=UPI002E1C592B|nr:META domain-containing protein [Streptomyces sp. NBC_01023]
MLTQRTAVAALALFTLAACGTEKGSAGSSHPADPDVPLTGTGWTVDSVSAGGTVRKAPAGADIAFEKGRVNGSSGCNHFSAPVTVKDDTLTVGHATSTLIGCPKNLQSYETGLRKTLTGKLTVHLSGGKLTLRTEKGDSVTLTRKPAERTPPLVGTAWKVDALTEGASMSTLPRGTAGKARLTFAKDGSVHGNLGCNRVSGMAKVTGSTVTFGPLTTTRMMCGAPAMSLERRLLKVLHGPVRYGIQHRALTLTAHDGTGIRATA